MNRLYFILALFLFSATAFTTKKIATNTSTDPAVFKLMEITYLWDLLKEGYEPDRDRDATWLDVGFRSKYAMAKKYAALEIVEAAFGKKIFLSGPHGRDMDFNSTNSFGHYNPAFLSDLQGTLETALANPTFKQAMETLYHQHLKGMAQVHFDGYVYMTHNPQYLQLMQEKYAAEMNNSGGMNINQFTEKFRPFADYEEQKGLDIYEGFNAPTFWLRRMIDGTAEDMITLQIMVMKALDADFYGTPNSTDVAAYDRIIKEQLATLSPTAEEHEYTILTKERVADALQTDASVEAVKAGVLLAEGSLAALGWFVLHGNDNASYELAEKLSQTTFALYNGTEMVDIAMANQCYSEMINLRRFNNQKPAMVSKEYAEIVQERIDQAFATGAGYDEFRLAEGSLVALGWITAYGNDQASLALGEELMDIAYKYWPESDGYYMKQSSEAYAEIINLGRFTID